MIKLLKYVGRGLMLILTYFIILLLRLKKFVSSKMRAQGYQAIRDDQKLMNTYSRVKQLHQRKSQADKILILDLKDLYFESKKEVKGSQLLQLPKKKAYLKSRPSLHRFLQSLVGQFQIVIYTNMLQEQGDAIIALLKIQDYIQKKRRYYKQWCTQGRKILNYVDADLSKFIVLSSNIDELSQAYYQFTIKIQKYNGSDEDDELQNIKAMLLHLCQINESSGELQQDLQSIRKIFGRQVISYE